MPILGIGWEAFPFSIKLPVNVGVGLTINVVIFASKIADCAFLFQDLIPQHILGFVN